MIDFDAYYVHRKKGFTVIVCQPAWWDGERGTPVTSFTASMATAPPRVKPPVVVVKRCGLCDGRTQWLMNEASFERTYKKQEDA